MSAYCPKLTPLGGGIERGNLERSRARPIPKYGYGYNDQFSSKPGTQHPTRPMYRNNVDRPRGVHDYYNVMWDPHVNRGKTYKTFQEVEGERAKVLGEAKKWHKRRRRATRFIPIQIPKTPPPPPIENYLLALDQFLIEGAPPTTTSHVAEQTDYINRKKRVKAPVEAKLGFDVSTEILPGELFSFDEEVEPIAHTVGQKVLEQALLESVEEEELMAIHKEQNEYEERRRLEALRVQHIQELTQLRTKELDEAMKRREAKRRKEKSVETRVGARMFSKSYLTLLVPQLFEGLRDDGFFEHVNIPSLNRNFTPWLNEGVEKELCQQLLAGGVLDLMLKNITTNREFEYLLGQIPPEDPEIAGEGQGEPTGQP